MSEPNAKRPFRPGPYMTFRVGDELFALDVFHVREVLDLSPVTRIPTAPVWLRGVVNVRGRAIPVVDLRHRFDLPEVAPTVNTRIIVLEVDIAGERCIVGGQADSVHEVIELGEGDVAPPPRLASRWQARMTQALARRGDDFVLVLDLAELFGEDELEVFGAEARVAA